MCWWGTKLLWIVGLTIVDNLCNVTNNSLFAIADPNQAANNNHVNSVSEVLPDSGTKTFYENLPFHGIQAPPNKVSIIIVA